MDDPKKTEVAMVQRVAEQLGEHFDTVQIFTTKHEPGTEKGTVRINYGVGNWYARYGHIVEWIIRHDTIARTEARRDFDSDNPI